MTPRRPPKAEFRLPMALHLFILIRTVFVFYGGQVEGGAKKRSQRYEQALKQIKEDISVRAEKLHSVNEAKKMNSELRFAKQLMEQVRPQLQVDSVICCRYK